jgi:hypothetical protein
MFFIDNEGSRIAAEHPHTARFNAIEGSAVVVQQEMKELLLSRIGLLSFSPRLLSR